MNPKPMSKVSFLAPHRLDDSDGFGRSAFIVAVVLPILISGVAIVAALSSHTSNTNSKIGLDPEEAWTLTRLCLALLAAGLIGYVLHLYTFYEYSHIRSGIRQLTKHIHPILTFGKLLHNTPRSVRAGIWIVIFMLMPFLIDSFGLSIFLALITTAISPLGIAIAWATFVIFIAVTSMRYERKKGLSIVLSIAALFLILSSFNWNDFHRRSDIRLQQLTPQEASNEQKQFDKNLSKWLMHRKELAKLYFARTGKPFPVIIVSAEGGGLYAAYQASKILATAKDRCPRIAAHVFGVTGVSGGALGLATYAGMTNESLTMSWKRGCPLGTKGAMHYEEIVRRFLSKDFLSSVLATGLFYDTFMNALPSSVLPSASNFNRGTALERAFEAHWSRVDGSGLTGARFFWPTISTFLSRGCHPTIYGIRHSHSRNRRSCHHPIQFVARSTG